MIYTTPFLEDLSSLDEARENAIWEKILLVESFPGVGSSLIEPSLLTAFGEAILKVSAAGYDVLYERLGRDESNTEVVRVLGIVPQRAIR